MNYYSIDRTPSLAHYGVKGMRRGVHKAKEYEPKGRIKKAVEDVRSNANKREAMNKGLSKNAKKFVSDARIETADYKDRSDLKKAIADPSYNDIPDELNDKVNEFMNKLSDESSGSDDVGIYEWDINVDDNGNYALTVLVGGSEDYYVKNLGNKKAIDTALKTKKSIEGFLNKTMKHSSKESEYYSVVRSSNEIAHSGIKGQKWGVQNGPPYPLDPSAKSVLEKREAKKAGKKAYGKVIMPRLEKKGIKYAAKRTTKLQKSINKHEKKIVNLAEKYKKNPTQENAEKFAKAIMNESIKQGRDIVKRDHFNEMSYTELGNMAKADTRLKINNGLRAVAGVAGTAGLISASVLSGVYMVGPGAVAGYGAPSIIAGTKNKLERKHFEESYHSGQISEKDAKAIMDYAKARSNEILGDLR